MTSVGRGTKSMSNVEQSYTKYIDSTNVNHIECQERFYEAFETIQYEKKIHPK